MCHRRFREQITRTKKNKKTFDGTIEKHHAPKIYSGEHIFRMVKDLKVILGMGKGGESKKTKKVGKMQRRMQRIMVTKLQDCLKKRSIFWNLPYWKDLMVRHAIDVMHVQEHVCKALVGTLLDIPGKIKDTLNAWMDLEEIKLRKDLHHETLENGSKNI
jgi:hypothetical protein